MKYLWAISLFFFLALILPAAAAVAQDGSPDAAVYIVQEGDNLWSISLRFGVSLDSLIQANNISEGSSIKPGDRLVIPGLEGITGELVTRPVQYGDSLHDLSLQHQLPEGLLARLNRVSSPQELYAGINLILLRSEQTNMLGGRVWFEAGQSLLETSAAQGVNPWVAVLANQYAGGWQALPGDVLHLPGEVAEAPSALPGEVLQVLLNLPLQQGDTTVLHLTGSDGLNLSGNFLDHELNFFPLSAQDYVALQGVHAMTNPGLYSLQITLTRPDGVVFTYDQRVVIEDAGYFYEDLYVDATTIDPQVTKPEDAQWIALAQPVTAEQRWNGSFVSPVAPDYTDCWPSLFGNRRSYNDSPYNYFHTGLDFCGQVGYGIFAPADGVVVFAGELVVRGNATMIDHGWGVYTAYLHQSEIQVQAGDRVKAGQQIGLVGATGRVTGPHLHWEVWVGGVQVDPMYWLKQAYP
ncbi:MAG: peptidoglycan DD-metalloendopeptidase family protein [Anaerolineales bacterium]|jgi:murein DD-endopeptidase MepM/ murein hydrolase activator NlpD|nr:peptidoglycan DD-metalloendopeptidase family protein [Anaerolineales bacterium]